MTIALSSYLSTVSRIFLLAGWIGIVKIILVNVTEGIRGKGLSNY